MPAADAIYVEIPVDAPLEAVWDRTQEPALHERWDLRFSDIEYLPRAEGEPRQLTYRTRIGGVAVEGGGESVATAVATSGRGSGRTPTGPRCTRRPTRSTSTTGWPT